MPVERGSKTDRVLKLRSALENIKRQKKQIEQQQRMLKFKKEVEDKLMRPKKKERGA